MQMEHCASQKPLRQRSPLLPSVFEYKVVHIPGVGGAKERWECWGEVDACNSAGFHGGGTEWSGCGEGGLVSMHKL